jgi:hypothetical protein
MIGLHLAFSNEALKKLTQRESHCCQSAFREVYFSASTMFLLSCSDEIRKYIVNDRRVKTR